MRKTIIPILAFSLLIGSFSFAEEEPIEYQLDAPYALIADYESGNYLYANGIKDIIDVGSATKLMTYLVLMDDIQLIQIRRLTDIITVDANALSSEDSSFPLERGQSISVNELISGMLTHDSDDAARALAIYFEKKEEHFVKKMNRKATQLGLKNTRYITATGESLTNEFNQSTLEDQFILVRHILKKYPVILSYFEKENLSSGSFFENLELSSYHFNGLAKGKLSTDTYFVITTNLQEGDDRNNLLITFLYEVPSEEDLLPMLENYAAYAKDQYTYDSIKNIVSFSTQLKKEDEIETPSLTLYDIRDQLLMHP